MSQLSCMQRVTQQPVDIFTIIDVCGGAVMVSWLGVRVVYSARAQQHHAQKKLMSNDTKDTPFQVRHPKTVRQGVRSIDTHSC